MKKDTWNRVNEIVSEALELDTDERSAFIDESCGNSPEVRREVESLLAGDRDAEQLFRSPAIAAYSDILERNEKPEAIIGQEIGQYRVIGELGWGGMGAVYLAERTDGKFEQKVALKLLKRELNTSSLRGYFRQERSILASLQHPYISRLLDAGTTSDRIPFLVMEYVDGLPIDEYCRVKHLSLNGRLDLFRKVCSAVDFAHRSLVIHRDLKPSNILVTSEGIPKLLDFGISKILTDNVDTSGSRTITRLGAMTPSYASPEQLRNESVTTASDVYSLGVILFELLAGKRPFEDLRDGKAETAGAVIDLEPPLPSAASAEISEFAAASDSNVPRVAAIKPQQLRGDLDNIVAKALKKEPERRYASAANVADDIDRFQSGFPVLARPDTFRYRASKFVRRNLAAVAATSILLIAVVGGMAATLWQASIAAMERDRAQLQAQKAEKINAYLQNVLNFSNPHWLSSNPQRNREATVAEAMDEALKNIEVDLAGEPEIQAEILFTLCQSYVSQGDYTKAERLARSAIEKFDLALGPDNDKSIKVGVILGDALYLTGKFDEAETYYTKSIEYIRPRLADDPSLAKWITIALNDMGNVDIIKGRFREAETKILEAISHAEKITGTDRFALPITLGNQASVLLHLGDFRGSIEYSNRSLNEMKLLGTDQTFEAGVAWLTVGRAYTLMDDYEQASPHYEKANQLLVSTVGEKNPFTQSNRYHTANNKFKAGQTAEALELVQKTIATQREIFPNGHFTISFSRRLLGEIYTKMGRLKAGEQELRDALNFMAKSVKEPNHEISLIKTVLGENLIAQKRMPEARETLNSALDGYLKTRGDDNQFTDRCRALLNSIPE